MENARFIMINLLIFVLSITVYTWFIGSLVKTAHVIKPENRSIEPRHIWLMLIPGFNYYLYFIVVSKLSASIRRAYVAHNIDGEKKPTYNYGMIAATGMLASLLDILVKWCGLGIYGFIHTIFLLITLAGLICWIIYWIKIVEHRSQIKSLNGVDTL